MDRKRKALFHLSRRHLRRRLNNLMSDDLDLITPENEEQPHSSQAQEQPPPPPPPPPPPSPSPPHQPSEPRSPTPQPLVDQHQYEDFVDEDLTESNFIVDSNVTLTTQLQSFVKSHNVDCRAVTDLLKILKPYHKELPLDYRTLMKTPRQSVMQEMHPGQYVHFGFKSAFIALLEKEKEITSATVKLDLNIDGLPLFKSSKESLWPILISIVSKQPVAIVGGYYGPSKPNVHLYLQNFIDEYNRFNTYGIDFNGKSFFPVIDILCCDAPAKCYVLCVKGHTGYSSCIKCKTEGIYKNNRLCFPDLEVTSPLRSDEEYRSNADDFHNAISPLAKLNQFHFIDNVPFDYMHLVCLGIMKKLILLWHQSKLPCSLQPRKILEISQKLEMYKKFCPSEFARKPRSLDSFKMWKATEYRQFLLYTGFGALETVVSREIFQSFCAFFIAMRIFTSHESDLYSYAKEMVIYFLKTFKILYGEHNMTHNVHALLHLHNDVVQHGPVDEFSAFKFENELFRLKNLVHTPTNPLQQIYNRINELGQLRQCAQVEDGVLPHSEHTEGPVLNRSVQLKEYHRAVFKGFKINTKKRGDQVFSLQCGSIVKIVNICVESNDSITILFQKMPKENLFERPCSSETIGLFKLSAPQMQIEQAPIDKIRQKFYCYPRSNSEEFIAVALQGNNK